ncbi:MULTISPECIES: hypothetical protein [unclassified Sporosarcina]|uniref:hypothetical protein n=1 Tax=unclassified Sporosarcina TaxID=2647733 RepID=UPI0030F6D08D
MNKIKVFIEYKVIPEKRNQYIELTEKIIARYQSLQVNGFSIYEGIEQPNLFVEDFTVLNYEQFKLLKTERFEERIPIWKEVHSCIHTGVKKVNAYAFEML